ncbi:ferritin-like domain-containing protein [Haoranjiania flava]|uniref:Ferritin-like domain-containing protein n=1 Tax=Haoranjiania flava TaxID=1856322 RepID=A0AAE3IQB9_9BACT|nr:ferritin-like domain-containing protein [Haoranjiania flava]MCU7694486.1 ferritin-like domain-containing protein [Haoranjiania flava]
MEKKKNVAEKSTAKKVQAKSDVAKSLYDLFEDGLKDIYWAEHALVHALPKMFENATDNKLKTAIKEHLDQTIVQVARLEEVFASIGSKAEAKKCDAMEGLLKEGESIMQETEAGAVRDAGIISAAQKVEHYEMATYGTLAAYAKTLNERTALNLLLKTLGEEKKADCLLSTIADTTLNSQAMSDSFQAKKINAV